MKNDKTQDPTMLTITTKNDEIKDLNYKTENYDREKTLKSLNFDNKYLRKKNV